MSNTSRLYLIGAGGHGRVVADVAEAVGYRDIRFLDERWPSLTESLAWPVTGRGIEDFQSGASGIVSIGDCETRLNLLLQLAAMNCTIPSLVHPCAFVSRHATLGAGTVVMPQAAINAGAMLGIGVIVNTGATIDHDCQIGDAVHVSPGVHLAGGVSVGEKSWIGIGAVVREGVRIGANSMIGAGAAVVSHVPDGTCVLGVPAKRS